ncbi:MAG: hypothetical protein JXX29_19370 [Deltaproteobacteria bacterium]|nr:hypothetical protein [Deltaproteobacteria bacterium]MBN2673849.1 hypothetical protein [Deltaproteobacteria bacterium]
MTRLSSEHLTLAAAGAEITLRPLRITAHHFDLTYDTDSMFFHLRGNTLDCTTTTCNIEHATWFPCEHVTKELYLQAEAIRITKEGTLRLKSPSLHVQQVKVLRLPSLVLRPPTRIGFLAPKLQWDPNLGLNIGPKLQIPLGDNRTAVSHVALRSAGGMDSALVVLAPAAQYQLDYAMLHRRSSFRLQARIQPALHHVQSTAELDIATHRQIVKDATFWAEDRALTHTENRARFALERRDIFIEQYAIWAQLFETAPYAPMSQYYGSIGISASILPLLEGADALSPQLFSSIETYAEPTSLSGDTSSRFSIVPGVRLSKKIGIVSTDLELGVLLQKFQTKGSIAGHSRQLFGSRLRLSLPLFKRYSRWFHMVDHRIDIVSAPLQYGHQATIPKDGLDMMTAGHQLQLSMAHTWGRSLAVPQIQFVPFYNIRATENRLGQTIHITGIRLLASLQPFQLHATGGMKPGAHHLSFGEIQIDANNNSGSGVSNGFYYYAAHSSGAASILTAPESTWPMRTPMVERQIVIFKESVSIRISSRLLAKAGFHLNLHSGIHMAGLYYQLVVSTPCKCLSATFSAMHLPEESVPRTFIQLSYSPQ